VKVICPECEGLIATAPADDPPTGTLICPHCGARVKGASAVDRLVGEVKHALSGED
jgi:uncharacterized Zn finger protein (UPF0148 family)